jgi:hypothetical protein
MDFDLNKKYKQFNKKLDKLQNTIVCILCSKLLYPQQSYTIKNIQV